MRLPWTGPPTDALFPLIEQGMINVVYTASCPTPADPMIVWGTQVDVEDLPASLRRLSQVENVLISPAHALLWAVARSLAEHPELNRRVINRRVHQFHDVNLVIPVLDRRRGQVEVALVRKMQDMTLAEVSRTLWEQARAKTDSSDAPSIRSWKQTRWGRWLRLRWIHHSVRTGFKLTNRFRIPNLGFNDEFNAASGMVNYLVFPNSPSMTSYKPSSLPASMALLNVTMGRGEPRPVVKDGKVIVRTMAPLFVRFDHRIGYTHQFAELITTLQRHLHDLAQEAAAPLPGDEDAPASAA